MCELLAFSSRRATRLSLSLRALAAHSDTGPRDGWGAAYFQGQDVALYREPAAAHDSPLEHLLETHGPTTSLAIAHIRHATQGAIALANTQPFVRELAGRSHVFAHNGTLQGIAMTPAFALKRFQPIGRTDSEHAFCALLERLQPLWRAGDPAPSLQARLGVVTAYAAELRELGPANFIYSDGDALFAHSHRRLQADGRIEPPGLYLLQRQCQDAGEALQTQGLCVDCGYQEVVLVASVPLSDDAWQPLIEGETVAVVDGQVLMRHPAPLVPL